MPSEPATANNSRERSTATTPIRIQRSELHHASFRTPAIVFEQLRHASRLICTIAEHVIAVGDMGCFSSKDAAVVSSSGKDGPTKDYRRPKWASRNGLTASKLKADREMFWDTQPHYGGSKEIWDALKAACEAPDFDTCKLILESAEVIVASKDMTVCYDQRGAKYELPKYVLSDPTDLVQD